MADAPLRRRLYRRLGYPPQAAAAWLAFRFFALLPVDTASKLGGLLGRAIGPLLPVTRRAQQNMTRAMPDLSAAQRDAAIRAMWDNLGRVLGEYPHLEDIARDAGQGGRVEVVGAEHLASVRNPDRPCILVSGHFANWEVCAQIARAIGIGYAQVYRAPNNPFVDILLRRARGLDDDDIVPKGTTGARKALAVLRDGRRLGILADQKMNDGISVPFFGRPAMMAPAVAQLALRFNCPVIPARLERLDGARFRVTFHPPLDMRPSGDRHADILAALHRINALFETWIRDRPDQWLWLHRRWPNEDNVNPC